MFNSPRTAQRYTPSTSFGSTNGFGSASFTASDPLAGSAYDGLDPWSSAPTPDLPPPPQSSAAPSPFAAIIADASAPPFYHEAYSSVDTGSGEISVNALSRVLLTSKLSASTIDHIVNLVSSRPRVSKLEFFVALALVALAQTDKEMSIENVASLAAQNNLPIPSLDLQSVNPTTATNSTFQRNTNSVSSVGRIAPQASYSDDPWQSTRTQDAVGAASVANGAPSSISGTGMPREWWRKQERAQVKIMGPQGFILNRYMVYEISTDRGGTVQRRYSEFAFLWDCLVRRYPFRILPQLPPKRIGPDESFLEQRRRGLQRFLCFIINHPVLKDDGVLAVFLSEPSFEQWRKHTAISLDEESVSKRVDQVEEMTIPRDLDEKLQVVRGKISLLIEHWQKIALLAERLIRRREAAAVRTPNALFKRSFLSTVLTPSVTQTAPDEHRSVSSLTSSLYDPSSSIFGSLTSTPLAGSNRIDIANGGFYTSYWDNPQADLSRLTMTMNALNEGNAHCWRGADCDLCSGVRSGLNEVSQHIAKQSDDADQRYYALTTTTLEAIKSQRDLYIAMRDLFIRHDRLSGDNVERLKKRIETNQIKSEGIRAAQKEGWMQEADKLTGLVERDQLTIQQLLNRRIFIRYSMWHELRVVLHNRENTLLTQAVRNFAQEESVYAENTANTWRSLAESVEDMPYE